MDESRGMTGALRRLAARAVSVLANRFELLAFELQEAQGRVLKLLLLAVMIVVLALLVLILGSFALVVWFWDTARFTVILALLGGYVLGALIAAWRLNRLLKAGNPFDASLEELKKDRKWLEGQRRTWNQPENAP